MKTRFLTTVILLLVICVTLCGCVYFGAAFSDIEVPNQPKSEKIRIYIYGAVQREGYYEVEVGTDYMEVLALAGLLPQSIVPTLSSSYVDGTITVLPVGYYDGDTARSSINVNSILITSRMPVDGLSVAVVNKLADYIEIHGKITNKHQVLEALGDDYDENYYKLYVAEIDYEEVN